MTMKNQMPDGDGRISLKPFFDGLKEHLRRTTADSLEAERTPRQLRAVAESATEAFGSAVAGLAKAAPPARDLACRKGCDHCCHQVVLTEAATVLRIAAHVEETFSRGDRMLLELRLIAYEEAVEKMGQGERARSTLPCPLLADGVCTVHAVRPMVCRSFNSYDAEACRAEIFEGGSTSRIPSWNVPWLLGIALDSGLKEALVDSGYADGDIELGLGLKAALDRPNAAERWLAGDRVFARSAWSARRP